jgi:predicted ATPase/DNA-binding SARP family transcriptional activator
VTLPAKQRRLLVALAIHVGEARSTDLLIEAVWGDAPAASADSLLQVYVSQLRKALPAPARIVTSGAGYKLELPENSLDAARFERLLDEGREAMRGGNPILTAALLRRALALWRGEAYGDFAYEDFARAEVERLEELRLACLEERFEAELAVGRYVEVLPELLSVAAAHPFRERLQGQAMLALYVGGRQTEALEVYAQLRSRLRAELGLEPGSELRELQRRILRHDSGLVVAARPAAPLALLPAPPNPLLGRERELDELRQLLLRHEVRLLTLSGAGGSGKTRLALELARQLADTYANGAAFVDLAPLRDPALVVPAIARVLDLQDVPGDPLEVIAAALRAREVLLVLDNAEHLRTAAPILVELLARAPRLTLLVTSRVVLHLSGERVYPVQPLSQEAAVALFHQRAREADAHFRPQTAEKQTIVRICERLDGLPLAIELAAARTRILSPKDLLERLDPRLPLLTGGPRDLPARQQTLRATLAWSVELLDDDERRDLLRLSVFVGSCTLEAAGAVTGTTIERLASLLDHNLLYRTTTTDDTGYAMLETIREYAQEQLDESTEANEIRRRHAEYFLTIAEGANLNLPMLDRGRPIRWDIATREQDEIRAALAWTLESRSVALGLRLATAAGVLWTNSDPREGLQWLERALESPDADAVPPEIRAEALLQYGAMADLSGEDDRAAKLYAQSLSLFEQLGDEHGRAVLLHRVGTQAMRHGQLSQARDLVEASHAIHERNSDRWGVAQTVGTLGAIARDTGDDDRAYALIAESEELSREVGVLWWEAGMGAELAQLAAKAGRVEEAENRAHASLALAEQLRDRPGCIFGVGLLAVTAAERGELERAGRLWGAIEDEDAGAPLGGWRRHRETCEARIRELAGPEFERGRDEGHTLMLDDAVTLALARHDETGTRLAEVRPPRFKLGGPVDQDSSQ